MLPEGYAVATYWPSCLSEAEMNELVELVRAPFMWFAPSSTDQDIVARLRDHESSVVDVVLRDGRPCGFSTCSELTCAGAKVLYRGGTVIEASQRSKGVYRALVELSVHRSAPEYLITRTQNPRIYETFRQIAGPDRVFPRIDSPVPEPIAAVAQACLHSDGIDPATLIVPDVYGDVRQDRSFMTARSEEVQRFFSQSLGRNDGFMVVVQLRQS